MTLGRHICRICGCWELEACDGGCWWVESDLCSACAGPEEREIDDEEEPPAGKPAHLVVRLARAAWRAIKAFFRIPPPNDDDDAWMRSSARSPPNPVGHSGLRLPRINKETRMTDSHLVPIETEARQGDVYLRRIDALPEGLAPSPRDEIGRIVLAYGESSGHAHAIRDPHVMGLRMAGSEEVDFIEVGGSGATLNHEYESGVMAEHHPLGLAPGAYEVIRQREYVAPDIERRAVD